MSNKTPCKPGDICIVIHPENSPIHGSIVRVMNKDEAQDRWIVKHMGNGALVSFPDSWLQPMREIFGADETITWAGFPPRGKKK